jgi:hypothetical protein
MHTLSGDLRSGERRGLETRAEPRICQAQSLTYVGERRGLETRAEPRRSLGLEHP